MNLVLVKTLRHEPGFDHVVNDPSNHVVEVKSIIWDDSPYSKHYLDDNMLIWITEEDKDYIHFIVNVSLYEKRKKYLSVSQSQNRILKIAVSHIRNEKISSIIN